jgi:outer membrane receptor protein involved in Fe transport
MLILSLDNKNDLLGEGAFQGRCLAMRIRNVAGLRKLDLVITAAVILIPSMPISAADTSAVQGSSNEELETVTITAAKVRTLEQFTPTGSRLGLSAQELPATLEVIDNDEMLGRGFFNTEQAADSQAGVTSGGSPGDQSQFSMRGFTGNQITVLRNGLYIGPSNMTTRDQNTFNVGSLEILKGPASVLYGQGAIAGVVNMVDKAPSFGTPDIEALASVGNFATTNVGVGVTTHFDEAFAIRADFSRTGTGGYVERAASNTTEGTVIIWRTIRRPTTARRWCPRHSRFDHSRAWSAPRPVRRSTNRCSSSTTTSPTQPFTPSRSGRSYC